MHIEEISIADFAQFANNHILGNFHQTIEYALLKSQEGYDYEFIAYRDTEIKAASLILYKKIGPVYYGYAPRGFLIDYSNIVLLEKFTKDLIEYYKKRNFAFIKINPEIAISKLNKNNEFIYNENYHIVNSLISTGYKKLKDNMNFEALLPRVNPIVDLHEFSYSSVSKNTRNKIKKGIRKGLTLERVTEEKLPILYEFIKNKKITDKYYYNDLYNIFKRNDNVDLLLVSIDYKTHLLNAQNKYEDELIKNNELNRKIIYNSSSSIINAKINSDKTLLSYKVDITEASKNLNNTNKTYIAGALVIKHKNRITIQISGFDHNYNRFAPNYFLYYAILNRYKNDYHYADLNGMTGDLSKDNYYYGLNRFKLGFNPHVYEFIGEFDLPIEANVYNILLNTGLLAKEFNKKN